MKDTLIFTLSNNIDNEEFKQLHDTLNAKYRVIARFKYLGYNGEYIECNNKKIVFRNDKFGPICFAKGVELIKTNISNKGGGSNRYPSVSFKGAFCEVEFISDGFPWVNSLNGWSIKIIKLEKLI